MEPLIEREYKKIYAKYWQFMKNEYIYNIETKFHRKQIINIKNIRNVKENIYNKLGDIPVFVFLTEICANIKIPGPYIMIEKSLLLIQYLLTGYTHREMEMYIPESSFFKIYESLFIKNYDFLEKWLNEKMKVCFSSPLLRLLCAKKFNPDIFNNVTLMLDGHHNRIIYQDINLDKKELYSWKLKNNGLNTQFIIDVNRICIYISESLPCKLNTDDNMLLDINLDSFYYETDCIAFDGLYENSIKEYIEKYKSIGYNISLYNFCFPIKKDKNVLMTKDERVFNEMLGGFRSKIETYFAELGNIFNRFNGKTKIRITDKKIYNLQLKLAIVLLNIKYFQELFPIANVNHYGKWRIENFEYNFKNKQNYNHEDLTIKTQYKIEKINDIKNLQNQFLNTLNINDDENNNQDMLLDPNENNLLDKKEDNIYIVQYIITHKKVLDTNEFFVKWKNYKKESNSWVKENDFIDKEMVKKYWKSVKRS